ncbi:MAG TPA: hypothetical protein PKA33_06275 [Amaricoccus sp.]|uniref:hypothetical protein n=1 Tax=Amaricoccus sp. TaxID=1872485 RepID=UPI002CE7B5E3|nr:hypothetical protein [Amaricoccus sp.]HMQ93044.1 hypothetical protein [Amaricoccus sp.]HMR53332.1 hypothetical protein [Amaricoccus sp.]HMR59468.1 hypothetical protein [Amaricoccus sp.]HMT98965.1 hypothetical protein [Amaricoccus sp.]
MLWGMARAVKRSMQRTATAASAFWLSRVDIQPQPIERAEIDHHIGLRRDAGEMKRAARASNRP